MSDNSKRRFWQIHLSTAVVLVVLAGIHLGLNLRIYRNWRPGVPAPGVKVEDYKQWWCSSKQGWPIPYSTAAWDVSDELSSWNESFERQGLSNSFSYSCFVIDVLVGIAFLSIVAFTLEYQVRRREARKL